MDAKEDSSSCGNSLSEKMETQHREIQRLNTEVKKLQKCVRGVNVLGRALKETKEENKRLRCSIQPRVAGEARNSDISGVDKESTPTTTPTRQVGGTDILGISYSTQDIDDSDDLFESDNNDESICDFTEDEESNVKQKSEDRSESKNVKCTQADENGQQTENHERRNLCKETDNVLEKVHSGSQDNDKISKFTEMKSRQDDIVENIAAGRLPSKINRTSIGENSGNPESTEIPNDSDVKSYEYVMEQDATAKHSIQLEQLQVSAFGVDLENGSEKQNDEISEENVALKLEVEKIVKANNDWEKFWDKKKTTFEKILEEKDVAIARLQQFKADHKACGQSSCTLDKMTAIETDEKEDRAESEKISLLTKHHVSNLESLVERLRSELTQEQQKSERAQKLARSLLQQKKELDLEVKRLNGTLETKVDQQKSLQHQQLLTSGLNSFSSGQLHSHDDLEIKKQATGKQQVTPKDMMQPIDMKKLAQTQMLRSGVEQHRSGVEQRQQEQQCEQQQQEGTTNDDDILNKEELKERIMLLKEQKNAYESDFVKERRDREAVVGQLEHVKEKLEKTKHMVKQSKHNVYQQTPLANSPRRIQTPGHNMYPPGKYYYPPQERNHLVAHGMLDDYVPQEHNWYTAPDHRPVNEDRANICLCPRHHQKTPWK